MAPDELQVFTLALVGISTALIGVFLVLRKSTMQANSLSHTTLLGITLVVIFYGFFSTSEGGQFLHFNLTKLIFAALITAFCTLFFTRFLQEKMGGSNRCEYWVGLFFVFCPWRFISHTLHA